MTFQSSVTVLFNIKHIDSNANLTGAGGFANLRNSAKCCFLIELTAMNCIIL